jgi:CO/xanthine dehydrogenase FAD-binding subunit
VVVVVGARASVGIAVAGAQDRYVRAIAVGEGLNGHLEAAALADELEEGGVDPVDDRALELARSTIRRVLADVGGEQVLGDEDALVVQQLPVRWT